MLCEFAPRFLSLLLTARGIRLICKGKQARACFFHVDPQNQEIPLINEAFENPCALSKALIVKPRQDTGR